MPGFLVTVLGLQGNGKSAFLMSHMDASARRGTSTLYVPLEVEAHECRTQWACWRLGYDHLLVKRQEWDRLPFGAQEFIEAELHAQAADPCVHFVPDRRITVAKLERWIRYAHESLGVRQVILDHFHRMEHGNDAAAHRLAVGEAARRLRDLARELGVVLIVACQLNRSLDPLDAYKPPLPSRVRDSSGLQDEPNVTLAICRGMRNNVTLDELRDVAMARVEEAIVGEPNTMDVTIRKHRDDGAVLNRRVRLGVSQGRVLDYLPGRDTPDWIQR
jgi:hypothetical protein